jgi:hypothetical protein
MNREDSFRKTRGFTLSAFVLQGIVTLGFVATLIARDGRMIPIDGLVLWTLIVGFLSALGSSVMAAPTPQHVAVRVTRLRERRPLDRRVVDLGSPSGIERRSGRDRRAALGLGAIVADYQTRV